MSVARIILAVIALAALISASQLMAADSGVSSPAIASAPLSTDQVVDNLVRRNQERAQALVHSEATRVYRDDAVSHVVGYASRRYGTAGLERTYNAELLGLAGSGAFGQVFDKFG